jgi:hypothetical protein
MAKIPFSSVVVPVFNSTKYTLAKGMGWLVCLSVTVPVKDWLKTVSTEKHEISNTIISSLFTSFLFQIGTVTNASSTQLSSSLFGHLK